MLSGAGCSPEEAELVGVVFQAIKVAQSQYDVGSGAGGAAFFGSDSQSREKAQLATKLMLADSGDVQDEHEELVSVPSRSNGWAYAFEGLVSAVTGSHVISGSAAGVTLLTELFSFL